MDVEYIAQLREQHPAWRLLRASNAPLVLSFLGDFFIESNNGATAASTLIGALDDHLYAIHSVDPGRYPRAPLEYLEEWAAPERGWLRRFYPLDSDEVHFDATPAVERAYRWVQDLRGRTFVGTESRLHTLVELLRQIVHGTETDPEARLEELHRRRAAIDEEIQQVKNNDLAFLDETGVKERYQLFAATARELLSDFREVEENFRALDRSAREQIAMWDGSKGALLAELVTSRADITTSDQGRSFQAFYDFLLSEERQSELSSLLSSVQEMRATAGDHRVRFIHHDWAEAAERTQHTVRHLTEQLRRFLEDQVWVENRRVLDLVRRVEQAAISVRDTPPTDVELEIDQPGISIALPFERPLYDPQPEARINSLLEPDEAEPVDYSALLEQRFVDTARLLSNIRTIVPPGASADLTDVLALYPVRDGAAEVLGYLTLSDSEISVELSAEEEAIIEYIDPLGNPKRLRMPQATVTRQ
ncbi:MAG TPA: DUF3375 domain-containing protein [Beutenbergiaceae bacterium]|nr:DUF3375 domain-containing protein [Beutenbergiaceae bacterium]